jgi:hypothetical protein
LNSRWQRIAVAQPDLRTLRSQLDRGLLFSLARTGIYGNHSGAQRAQHSRAGGTGNADTGNADRQLAPRRIMGSRGQP